MWAPVIEPVETADRPLYVQVVDALERDIEAGHLSAGMPLPPQRKLAHALGLAAGTIRRAYREAEDRGLIEGHVGRGTIIRAGVRSSDAQKTLPVAVPATVGAFSSVARSVAGTQQASGTINLALNEPPDVAALAALKAVLSRPDFAAEMLSATRYGPAIGHESHRQIFASWLLRHGRFADWRQLIICNGAQHGMRLVFQAIAAPGSAVLVEDTIYSGMKSIAAAMNLELVPVAMDEDGLLPDDLVQQCRQTAARILYTIPTLHNPTTRTMSRERRHAIIEVARRENLLIVEDDVYGMLLPDAPPPLSALASEICFYISSLSKVIFPGLRTGFVVTPDNRWLGRITRQVQADSLTTASFNTALSCYLIEEGSADIIVREITNEAACRLAMTREIFGQEIALQTASGGFHVWLPMSQRRAEQIVELALQQSVALTPPSSVMVGQSNSGLRLCLGAPKIEDLSFGLNTLKLLIL